MSNRLNGSTLDAVWKDVSGAIEKIYQFQSMNVESYMKLFSMIYDYCSQVISNPSSRGSANRSRVVGGKDGGQVGGEDLYLRIKDYLTNYVRKILQNGVDLQGDNVLLFYGHQWDRYIFPSKVVNGICSYLNQHWITNQIKAQTPDIYEIFVLTMKIWEDVFFTLLNKRVTEACLNSIQADRNHEVVDTRLIGRIIQSYVTLGCGQDGASLRVYQQFFEESFLLSTEQFYRLEATNYLRRNSVTDYLKKVAQRLDEEDRRVRSYLHRSTLPILIQRLDEVLIHDRLDVIYAEAKVLLRDNKQNDLILLHKLVSRIPNAINPLKDIVEKYIEETGLDAIERIQENALNNPKVYIETILDAYKKANELVRLVFENKPDFLLARDAACVKFINRNVVTQSVGNATKSPELLARYCDVLLRKGNRGLEENTLEEKFDEIMAVFNYMEDKDVFEKFYRNRLAKRLVGQLSASDDYEELMISKLKQTCGYEYTVKLQRMFQDIGVSKNITNQYRTYCEKRKLPDTDFSVMVLTYNSWPFSAPPTLILPAQMQRTIDSFKNFYSQQHSGRKLMWLFQHCRGELHTTFTRIKHIIQVSTYQMTILLLFNQQTTWIVEQLHDRTQIPNDILLQVLSTLLKIKLINCTQIQDVSDELKESDIQLDYQMKLSDDFRNKNVRINLNTPLKSIEQKENDTVHRTIDEDRKLLIQAAIVRIMKARQTLKHALLMQEVIQQLSSRFKPQIPQIKKCIDILIEKEYLERNATEKDILRYLA